MQFSGKLDFLPNGYDIDFTLTSEKSELENFITALPPQYVTWQQQAKIKGTTDFLLKLKGQYIAATNTMPDLVFNMKIRDGFLIHQLFFGQCLGNPVTSDKSEGQQAEQDYFIPLFHGRNLLIISHRSCG